MLAFASLREDVFKLMHQGTDIFFWSSSTRSLRCCPNWAMQLFNTYADRRVKTEGALQNSQIDIYIYIRVYTHVSVHIHIFVSTNVYEDMYIHIFINTYTLPLASRTLGLSHHTPSLKKSNFILNLAIGEKAPSHSSTTLPPEGFQGPPEVNLSSARAQPS